MTQRKIKELRFKMELTQVQFADKVGVSLATVKSWEQGVNQPNERFEYKLKQIAKGI
jgi:DNA-binding transcriptional regulator YiaG